jgi:hypothetical protein
MLELVCVCKFICSMIYVDNSVVNSIAVNAAHYARSPLGYNMASPRDVYNIVDTVDSPSAMWNPLEDQQLLCFIDSLKELIMCARALSMLLCELNHYNIESLLTKFL